MNAQTREKLDRREDGSLDVVSIFPTFQGEGPFAGRAAVFVRLAGCNLKCPLCDTNYTTNRRRYSAEELHDLVRQTEIDAGIGYCCLVVITGGEPFRQNLTPFVRLLVQSGYDVQVETNGTLYLDGFPTSQSVSVVCSPKTTEIDWNLRRRLDAWKYVLHADHVAADGLPLSVLGLSCPVARPIASQLGIRDSRPIYVQPEDSGDEEQNRRNLEAAMQSCRAHGFILSLQLHKLIGLP